LVVIDKVTCGCLLGGEGKRQHIKRTILCNDLWSTYKT